MAAKHLQELLNEEQEPFVLNNYLNERRSQLRRSPPKTHLHLRRRKLTTQNPIFSCNFRKSHCFFNSNAVKGSPLFDFQSPAVNPFLKSVQKPKSTKNLSFGLLRSILRRISPRKREQNLEICIEKKQISVKDILRRDSFDGFQIPLEERSEEAVEMGKEEVSEVGFSCSWESSGWSEDFEEKSMDLGSSSSCSSCCRSLSLEEKDEGCGQCKNGFCSSPFIFRGLKDVSDSGLKTPEFMSPAGTPGRRKKEILGGTLCPCTGADASVILTVKGDYEEEKEQFSPVSVLDAPFDDDEDGHEEEGEGEGEEDDDQIFESTYAAVQRAKHKLMSKILRFEQLANLDPFELEERIAEAEGEETEEESDEMESNKGELTDKLLRLVMCQSIEFHHLKIIPPDMKRLVLDLVDDETEEDGNIIEVEAVAKKVSKRIESWKDVQLNTIDMTIELDFRREGESWRKHHEEVQDMAVEIEFAIFGFLIKELTSDLVGSGGH